MEVKDYTETYIEIYTLFHSFFLSRTLTGEITPEINENLEIVIDKSITCWRNLRLSTKIVKIHRIKDHLLNQIKKYNGIGCFIECFIEHTYQFGMLDEKRTANMRDRVKTLLNHSKMESISNNGEVKLKIIQVRMETRRKQNTRKQSDCTLSSTALLLKTVTQSSL